MLASSVSHCLSWPITCTGVRGGVRFYMECTSAQGATFLELNLLRKASELQVPLQTFLSSVSCATKFARALVPANLQHRTACLRICFSAILASWDFAVPLHWFCSSIDVSGSLLLMRMIQRPIFLGLEAVGFEWAWDRTSGK